MRTKGNIYWILLGALGLFLIIGHNMALGIVCKVIGACMAVSAVFGIIDYFRNKDLPVKLVGSILSLLLGLWIFGNSGQFITLINVVIGVIMIISGTVNLYHGWKAGLNKVSLIFPCISILLGIIIACNNAATSWVTIAAGIGLVYSAVTGYLGWRS